MKIPKLFKYRIRALRYALTTLFARIMIFLLGLLPERILCGLLRYLGGLAVRPLVEREAKKNLAIAFPDKTDEWRRQVIDRMSRNCGSIAAEIILARKQGPDYIHRMIIPDATIGNLQEALSVKKGIILVTAHFGNWELLSRWVALDIPLPTAALVRNLNNPSMSRLINKIRKQGGIEIMDRDEPVRKIARHLAKPGSLGILPDQNMDVLAGEFLPFFGQDAYTPTGPAAIAILSGAPIQPVFMVREGGRFRLTFSETIYPDKNAPKRKEITRITKAWSAAVEEMLRRYPDHWMWWHSRWAATPERVAMKRKRHQEKKVMRARAATEEKP